MPDTGMTIGLIKALGGGVSEAEVEELRSAIAQMPGGEIEYKFSGTDLLLGFGYTANNDAVIVMNNGRANGLFDFAKLCTKPHGTSLENLNTADLTTVWNSTTDMHAPFQFLAVSNADGYHSSATSAGFVGGNHTLDNLGTGFETAESVYVRYYANGVPVSTGYGHASNFEIRWANDVQAYNTVKQGGGGRACLREFHDMIFDGVTFRERITLKALEAITLSLWYGLQCVSIGTTYTSIAFVDASNRGTFSSSDNSITSGNAATSGFIGWGDDHRIEMSVDTSIDLGKRTYYNGTSGAFVSSSKGYFNFFNQNVSAAAGAMYYLDGSYRFLPVVATASKPCTGLTLNKSTMSFDTINDTDTLTATPTPSDTTDTITWSTSDSSVATVNNGTVTAKANGTATITATCGQQTATCSVTVSASQSKPCTAISLSASTLSFDSVGETKTLTATLTPSDTTDSLTWASSDTNVATVNSSGVVTIHGIGTATITATCGTQSATCSISQTSIKAQYEYTKITGKTAGGDGLTPAVLNETTNASQSIGGQPYHDDDKLRIRYATDVECIPVPYGATKLKYVTTGSSVSYTEFVNTTSLVDKNGVNHPEWIKNQTFISASTGYDVEYGQALVFRGPSERIEAVQYVYFE